MVVKAETISRREAKLVALADTGLNDAFGRLRVSSLASHIDAKNVGAKNTRLFVESVGGSGNSSYDSNDSSVSLSVSGGTDWAIRQTRGRGVHIGGKSYVAIMTMAGFSPASGVLKRVGYYSSSVTSPFSADIDGLCFESDDTGVYVCLYKNGTAVHRVHQDKWNRNRMNGSIRKEWSLSGTEWDKSLIPAFDFAWLGVGGIRFGFMIDREFVVVHEIDNFKQLTGTFMRSPNKPMRYEIRSSGGAGSLKQICCSCGGEAGETDLLGTKNVAHNDNTTISATANILIPILAIRVKKTRLDTVIIPTGISILSDANNDFRWAIAVNPELTRVSTVTDWDSLSWTSVNADSGVEYFNSFIASDKITDENWKLDSGYGDKNAQPMQAISGLISPAGCTVDGKPDVIVLYARTIGSGTPKFSGSISFKEYA